MWVYWKDKSEVFKQIFERLAGVGMSKLESVLSDYFKKEEILPLDDLINCYYKIVYSKCDNNKTLMAKKLGLTRKTIRLKIQEQNLEERKPQKRALLKYHDDYLNRNRW